MFPIQSDEDDHDQFASAVAPENMLVNSTMGPMSENGMTTESDGYWYHGPYTLSPAVFPGDTDTH
jgi:hypothetical protein